MRVDIMTDIETLGTDPNSTIFQIAAIAFDINSGQKLAYFNKVADISKNESYEMNVSGSTLKWWLNSDKELLTELLNKGEGSSSELVTSFHEWLTGISVLGDMYLWGNGILFDNNFIRTQFEAKGLKYPIQFRCDRDFRTILDLACAKFNLTEKELRHIYYDPTLQAHNAIDDVKNQINLLTNCYRELTVRNGIIGDVGFEPSPHN